VPPGRHSSLGGWTFAKGLRPEPWLRISWENPMGTPRVSGFDVHLNESIDA